MLPRLAELFGITTDALLGVKAEPGTEPVQTQQKTQADPGENDGLAVHWDLSRKSKLSLAVWILLAAAVLVAANLMRRDVTLWNALWTSGLLSIGLMGLCFSFSFLYFGCAVFGGYFVMNALNVLPVSIGKNWTLPILLLLLGGSLLAEALRKKGRIPEVRLNDKNAVRNLFEIEDKRFRAAVRFAEMERTVCVEELESGSALISFGELELDLSGCEGIGQNCVIDVCCAFGELTIKVPRKVAVITNLTSSFGDVDTDGEPLPNAVGTVLITGSVSFGSVTVEYI